MESDYSSKEQNNSNEKTFICEYRINESCLGKRYPVYDVKNEHIGYCILKNKNNVELDIYRFKVSEFIINHTIIYPVFITIINEIIIKSFILKWKIN